jgi:hypothetical protein
MEEQLKASEGKVYALKSDLSIYGNTIILGKEDTPDNWIEIPEPVQNNEPNTTE